MTEDTTWENIANLILSGLEHLNSLISKLRGQSYNKLICLVNVMV